MAHRITTTAAARVTRSAAQVRGISSSRVVRGGHAAPEQAGESATTNECEFCVSLVRHNDYEFLVPR